MRSTPIFLLGFALLASAGPSRAEPLLAVTTGGKTLLSFDSNTPATVVSTSISGFQGGASETIVGVDVRPADGLLYAVGRVPNGASDDLRLYRLDASTGALTAISAAPIPVTAATQYGMDFNPTVDRLRVVNNADDNLRINPGNGTRADSPGNDTDLNPAGALIDAVAYDRNFNGPPLANATTLYAISRSTNALVTIGGVNQSPSPNGGAVFSVGALGVSISAANGVGLEVFQSRTAFAAFTSAGSGLTGLYAIDLPSGAATLVGLIGDGSIGVGGLTAGLSLEQVAAIDAASGQLFRFDTQHPDLVRGSVAISGLLGGPTERIVGLDVRPSTGELFAIGRVPGATDTLQVYRVDAITGAATAIGAPLAGIPAGTSYGADFNPFVDRIRVVNTSDLNLRLNPLDGTIAGTDTTLNPPGNQVDAVAYDRNVVPTTLTTLFAIARNGNQLMRIGGVDSSPSPNGGVLTAIGPLGATIAAGSGVGFDIVGQGTAYAGFTAGGQAGLYVMDLVRGAASLVGPIGAGAGIAGMAVLPATTPLFRDGFE